MQALQGDGKYRHYDVHSLYGWSEAEPTLVYVFLKGLDSRAFLLFFKISVNSFLWIVITLKSSMKMYQGFE